MKTRLSAALLVALAAVAPVSGAGTPTASAGTAGADPLAAGPWGVYTGPADGVYPAWQAATGSDKALLAKVALRPRVRWFTSSIPTDQVEDRISTYVTRLQAEAGTPDVLVQLATFRLWPQGERNKAKALTAADQAAYRAWVDAAARGIGSARAALVLEPDLGVALTGWKPAVRLKLAAYAAKVFGALPRTSVYLDAADSDWLSVSAATRMLVSAGVAHLRGFALGATHYTGVAANIAHGRDIVAALAKAGVPGRHFVIDTADNGRPFTYGQYYAAHPHGDFDNAQTCTSRTQRRCDTLGIPPTARVDDARWGLSGASRTTARKYVDAYLWFGRPWLVRQASPFSEKRTLAVARTTPYPGP